MSRIIITPYKKAKCPGARRLADAAEVPCYSASYIGNIRPATVYINWGSTGYELRNKPVVNHPGSVYGASNKVITLTKLKEAGIRVPWFTTDIGKAFEFMKDNDKPLIARTVLRGSKGRGIVFIENKSQFIDAPLYTEFLNKVMEFRVHVFKGQAIDIVRKKRRMGTVAPVVWSRGEGYSFSHNTGITNQSTVERLAWLGQQSVQALDLEFGAVDIMLYMHRLYVLEINTAPGLNIEQTLVAYANKIKELKNEVCS